MGGKQKIGRENPNFTDHVGEKHITNEGYEVEIIECIDSTNCTIKFKTPEKFIKLNVNYSNLKKGNISNPYHKSVYGVGYYGEGDYNYNNYKIFTVFNNIFGRCYSLKSNPSYKDCSVDKIWHNFQVFAEWMEENYKENFHLDKDILVKGNKIYSPEMCCFVPQEINNLFTRRKVKRGNLPIGVTKSNSRYQSSFIRNNKKVYLGTFNTPEEAFQAYKKAKEQYIKEVADKWKDQIDEKVYQAMHNYQVEITD